MKVTLSEVNINSYDVFYLYELLKERTPEQSISHKKMPSFRHHELFVKSRPYKAWYVIKNIAPVHQPGRTNYYIGSVYITDKNEIGLFIAKNHRNYGYGAYALEELMSLHAGPYYANINPNNKASIEFFKKFGATHIQNTYVFNK